MDYNAKIEDIKGAIRIKERAKQGTSVLLDRLEKIRRLQLKAENKAERKRKRELQNS